MNTTMRMSKLTKLILCCVPLIILLNSCSKEYSCEDCFIPKQIQIDCQAITVGGVFQQGEALDSGNYIEITVQLPKAGYYYFLTEKVNGISFSIAGDYSAGQQIIRLPGTGIPVQDGSFNYHVNNNESCLVNVKIARNVFYYSATIDGVNYEARAIGTNGITAWGGGDWAGYTAALAAVVGHNAWPPATGYTGLMIRKGWIPQYSTATNAQVKDFLAPGIYPFVDPNWAISPPLKNGVSIVWYDLNGQIWYSDPSDNQTGRSFRITSCVEGPPATSSYYPLTITAEFNCKLYNSVGDVKTLTNGKFYGFTGRY